jgi:hypothetical protein
MGVHSICILQDETPDGDNSKAYIQVRSHSGRPPIVNGVVTSIRAIRNEKKSNEIHWTVHNVASYSHTRAFATRFKHVSDAEEFLLKFNDSFTTAEVDEWLTKQEIKLAGDASEQESDEKGQGKNEEGENELGEAIDNDFGDEFNECTQNWPDWHDMSTPFD